MANDKDIQVGNKVIGESTKITLTVKTALWIIGIIIVLFSTAFTVAYFDIKSEVKSYKDKLEIEQEDFVKKVQDNIEVKLDKQREKTEEFIKAIEEIRGNIRLILDRTQRSSVNPDNGVNTINNNQPIDAPTSRGR